MTEQLKIYDPSLDEARPATQADVDLARKASHCLGLTREILRKISERSSSDKFDIDEHIAMLSRMLGA